MVGVGFIFCGTRRACVACWFAIGKRMDYTVTMLSPLRGSLSPLGVSLGAAAQIPWYLAAGIGASHVAAWQFKGAASQSASYTKLGSASFGNPSIDPAIVGGVESSWDTTNGIYNRNQPGDGTQYYKTGITPSGGAFSMIVRFSNESESDGGVLVGSNNGGVWYILSGAYVYLGQNCLWGNGGSFSQGATHKTSGIIGVCGNTAYAETSVITTEIATGGAGSEIYLLAYNSGGATDRSLANLEEVWFADVALTEAQYLLQYAAIAAL